MRRDPTRVGECSACRAHAHLVARNGATALCRACATVYVTGEIAHMEPGIAREQIETVLVGICTHRGMLHAWKLGFFHPRNSEWMEFQSPIPGDFSEAGIQTILK